MAKNKAGGQTRPGGGAVSMERGSSREKDMGMKQEPALIVSRTGARVTLTINNPKKLNALTPGCLLEIERTFDELAREDETRVVVLRGAGDQAFSAGADIMAMPVKGEVRAPEARATPTRALEAIQRFPYPVVAMLYGYALGAGCILALACDIRIAAESVKMGVPTSRMGLLSDYRTFKRFLTVLGYGPALEIFLTGRSYDSRECLAMGLVGRVVETERLESFTEDLVGEIARCAPLSLRGSKLILNKIAENPTPVPEDLETFRALSLEAVKSDDHEEAKRAFREKRKPHFTGR